LALRPTRRTGNRGASFALLLFAEPLAELLEIVTGGCEKLFSRSADLPHNRVFPVLAFLSFRSHHLKREG